MGEVDSYKKNGPGIILIDNGVCAITNHSHDNMIKLNLIFKDRSLTILTVKNNKIKYITFRTGSYLMSCYFNSGGNI
jgi:hypothetical protein